MDFIVTLSHIFQTIVRINIRWVNRTSTPYSFTLLSIALEILTLTSRTIDSTKAFGSFMNYLQPHATISFPIPSKWLYYLSSNYNPIFYNKVLISFNGLIKPKFGLYTCKRSSIVVSKDLFLLSFFTTLSFKGNWVNKILKIQEFVEIQENQTT